MDTIIILDFGSQYSHLIARRVRELGVYSEVMPGDTPADELKAAKGLKGIILSGSGASVHDDGAPTCDSSIPELDVPVFGICYGYQLLAYMKGGTVTKGEKGEYGMTTLSVTGDADILDGLQAQEQVWMNHRDVVKAAPAGFEVAATTDHSPVAAFADRERGIYGVQFHPEVSHTPNGNQILRNFVHSVCKAAGGWDISTVIRDITKEITSSIGDRKAIMALSGGIDSSTAAVLVSRVIGENLTAVFVDTGLMREGETEIVRQEFLAYDIDLRVIDARERFFAALSGITSPEEKRRIIGRLFIEIFDEVAREAKADVLVQGTIYSDRIESGITKNSSNIKSHHNVGGLPEKMGLEVYEPLRDLYKDEVREIARQIGISESIRRRHVFPGPGLAIRIIGEVTPQKADIVRRASAIIEDELESAGWYEMVWMAFAVLLSVKSVGIQGDARSYRYPVVVRIIESRDAMTANFAKVPYEILERISSRITNELHDVNRVVYDVSHKPPATMEWE